MNNTNEIIIKIHKEDPQAFYAKIPYNMLPKIHRIGGKWMQSGKEWRFPLDEQIWEKFQKEFKEEIAQGIVKKDLSFILAFEKRKKDLNKFLEAKEIAMKDTPTDFGVEGVGINGKNCLFNYQRWGIKCGLSVGDGFLIGDAPGIGKCLCDNNFCQFDSGIKRVKDIIENIPEDKWYLSNDNIGEWNDSVSNIKILGNDNGKLKYFNVKRVYREKVLKTGTLITQNGLYNEFGMNHHFFTNNGWKKLSELTENDWILCENNIETNIKKHYNNEDVNKFVLEIIKNNNIFINNEEISILNSDDENVRNFIKLLFEEKSYFNHNSIEFLSESYQICEIIWYLLKRFGVLGIIQIDNEDKKYWNINIDEVYLNKFKKEFGFLSANKQIQLENLCLKLNYKNNIVNFFGKELQKYCNNNFQWLKVKKVIENNNEKYVYDFEVDNECHNYFASGMLTHNTIQGIGIAIARKNQGEVKNCLIVCPSSLKYNWRDEIIKFTGLTPLVIGHKCKNKEEREKQWIATGYFFKIVNYEILARDLYADPKKADNRISSYKAVLSSFDMCIWDEMQYLKHHNSIRTQASRIIKTKYRIGLTGTPLDGRLEEIHSIFQILKPGLFVSKQKFMERYAQYDYFGAVKGYHHIKQVSDKISPYYLRRLKQDVLKDLPPKLFKDMHVELSPKNMKAYKDLIKKKDSITENATATELLIRARQFLDFPEILGIHNPSDKYAVFKELIDDLVKENKQKVVVFSQYTNTIHWIVKNLETEYDGIQVIDGSVPSEERQEICKKFNNDPNYNILIMSDAGAQGLNLQSGSAVIHFSDSYSPAKQQQRNDRCHRATTKHSVTIYRFVTDNTIEQHIRDILGKKMIVTNALLGENCDEFDFDGMSPMELLSCL